MRRLLILLVLANVLAFCWWRGWFDDYLGSPRDPDRAARQVGADRLVIVPLSRLPSGNVAPAGGAGDAQGDGSGHRDGDTPGTGNAGTSATDHAGGAGPGGDTVRVGSVAGAGGIPAGAYVDARIDAADAEGPAACVPA